MSSLPAPEAFVRGGDAERAELLDYREKMVEAREARREPPVTLAPPEPTEFGRVHLVIGDSHTTPEASNQRFELLGQFATKLQPDVIVDIGDWWDMGSLCHYDRGKKCFEGRRYWKDIEAGIDAQQRFQAHYEGEAKLVRCLGNHENRITRCIEEEPRLEGVIGLEDLASKQYGWTEVPFLEPTTLDGITYAHYYSLGGRPPGAKRLAAWMVMNFHKSVIAGHSHKLDYCEEIQADGKRVQAMVVGCYFTHHADWATPSQNQSWRRGLTVLRHIKGASFDPEFTSWEAIVNEFA